MEAIALKQSLKKERKKPMMAEDCVRERGLFQLCDKKGLRNVTSA